MLGILIMLLTAFMIYSLVKNALLGKQLSANDTYNGSVELLIPITSSSEFYIEPWMKTLNAFSSPAGAIKVRILILDDHPSVETWREVSSRLPHVELFVLIDRPFGSKPLPWMLSQIAPLVRSNIVIVGDAELVPTEAAFFSLSKLVTEKQRPVFVVPQTTNQLGILGETIALLNPTLALTSVFGLGSLRKKLSYPLMSISQGWMGMSVETFKRLPFESMTQPSWKEALSQAWDNQSNSFVLAFGEKQLVRYFAEDVTVQINQLKTAWAEYWKRSDRTAPIIFTVILFAWSFPVLSAFTHPFWALASFLLLLLYRFFTKIIFQESFLAAILHPIASVAWVGTLIWWSLSGRSFKARPARLN
jgi:hypothetical protein